MLSFKKKNIFAISMFHQQSSLFITKQHRLPVNFLCLWLNYFSTTVHKPNSFNSCSFLFWHTMPGFSRTNNFSPEDTCQLVNLISTLPYQILTFSRTFQMRSFKNKKNMFLWQKTLQEYNSAAAFPANKQKAITCRLMEICPIFNNIMALVQLWYSSCLS